MFCARRIAHPARLHRRPMRRSGFLGGGRGPSHPIACTTLSAVSGRVRTLTPMAAKRPFAIAPATRPAARYGPYDRQAGPVDDDDIHLRGLGEPQDGIGLPVQAGDPAAAEPYLFFSVQLTAWTAPPPAAASSSMNDSMANTLKWAPSERMAEVRMGIDRTRWVATTVDPNVYGGTALRPLPSPASEPGSTEAGGAARRGGNRWPAGRVARRSRVGWCGRCSRRRRSSCSRCRRRRSRPRRQPSSPMPAARNQFGGAVPQHADRAAPIHRASSAASKAASSAGL